MDLILAKKLTPLDVPNFQGPSIRMSRKLISISDVGKATSQRLAKLAVSTVCSLHSGCDWRTQFGGKFVGKDEPDVCRFVRFGCFLDAEFAAVGTPGNVVCNSRGMNTCTEVVGGYPHHFCTLLRVSTMGRHISKALRGFALASRVLREEIAF